MITLALVLRHSIEKRSNEIALKVDSLYSLFERTKTTNIRGGGEENAAEKIVTS